MGHTLKRKQLILVLAITVLLQLSLFSQPIISKRSERAFLEYVLSDSRNEPDILVFEIVSTNYSGPVIDFGGWFGLFLAQRDTLEGMLELERGIEWLLSGDPIVFQTTFEDCCSGLFQPPTEHAFYRFLKRNPRKLIKKYFKLNQEQNRYFMINSLNESDQLALMLVLFKHQIPVYQDGWGVWIDTNTEHSPDR